LWRSRWNVDWQGKPKFSEKTCPSATFVHYKIPHDQTRVWNRAAAVGSRRLTAWAMARHTDLLFIYAYGAIARLWAHILDWQGGFSTGTRNFFSSPEPRTNLGIIQSPMQWVPRALYPGDEIRVVKLTRNMDLVLRVRKRGATHLLPIRLHGVVPS
jgi:hypothetical protein